MVFHIPTAPDTSRIPKLSGQQWVAWSMESAVLYPQLANLEYMRRFDLTMTYRLDSDLPCPYFGPATRDALLRPPSIKTAEAPAVYFASNPADKSGRMDFVRELMSYLAVDSYGACLNNRRLPEDRGPATKRETLAKYKFTIACENSIASDYVTEKFFDPLVAGSVPVYWGAPNIAKFAPGEHCFIDARAFGSPRELAEHLTWLAGDADAYQAYLHWKAGPLRPEFLRMVERVSRDPFSRLATGLLTSDGIAPDLQRDPMHRIVGWLNRRGWI